LGVLWRCAEVLQGGELLDLLIEVGKLDIVYVAGAVVRLELVIESSGEACAGGSEHWSRQPVAAPMDAPEALVKLVSHSADQLELCLLLIEDL